MESGIADISPFLHKFWMQKMDTGRGNARSAAGEWNEQNYTLSLFGMSMEEALNYIYTTRPPFATFMNWLQQNKPATVSAEILPGDVLTAADHDSWHRNGYLVIRNAVPEAQCAAARAAIWEFLDADLAIPESWYRPHPGKRGLMLSFFQHAALIANRNSARIRKAYQELYEGTDIYLPIDKVSFNPPETATYSFAGSPLHWDVSLSPPIPFVLQGLLYLNDVQAADGAFHCVPGFHNELESWLGSLPPGSDPRAAALTDLKPVAVPGNAGDLVIWHHALPHCATPNKGAQPRMVQYIAYKPVHVAEQPTWK